MCDRTWVEARSNERKWFYALYEIERSSRICVEAKYLTDLGESGGFHSGEFWNIPFLALQMIVCVVIVWGEVSLILVLAVENSLISPLEFPVLWFQARTERTYSSKCFPATTVSWLFSSLFNFNVPSHFRDYGTNRVQFWKEDAVSEICKSVWEYWRERLSGYPCLRINSVQPTERPGNKAETSISSCYGSVLTRTWHKNRYKSEIGWKNVSITRQNEIKMDSS